MNFKDELLQNNHNFLERNPSLPTFDKKPSKKLAIVTCMDTRLVDFAEKALGISRGEANIIKTAGNVVRDPYGDVVKSLLVSIYELGVNKILVLGHKECGMRHTTAESLAAHMKEKGISEEEIDKALPLLSSWADPFTCAKENVLLTVEALKNHPLIPKDVEIVGLFIYPDTGVIEELTPETLACSLK